MTTNLVYCKNESLNSAYVKGYLDGRISNGMHTLILTNSEKKRSIYNVSSDLTYVMSDEDLDFTQSDNPEDFATYIINLCKEKFSCSCEVIVDGFDFDLVNDDYKLHAYLRHLRSALRLYHCKLTFTLDGTKHSLDRSIKDSSDTITYL